MGNHLTGLQMSQAMNIRVYDFGAKQENLAPKRMALSFFVSWKAVSWSWTINYRCLRVRKMLAAMKAAAMVRQTK
jgi:hypothetical protein